MGEAGMSVKFALHSFLAAPYYGDPTVELPNTKPVRVVLYEPVAALRKELREANRRIQELQGPRKPKKC